MKILYYLTAHGYGHAVRSCAIISQFSQGVRVALRTAVPLKFFQEELRRPFDYFPGQFDCGCVQGDSVTVDREATLAAYGEISARNRDRLEEEAQWCLDLGADGIVSDIPPFAFEVARKAGLPSVAVTNFTWYDIYQPYARDFPAFEPQLNRIREQYGMAGLLLELAPSNGMDYFPKRIGVPLVGRSGREIRARLKAHLGVGEEKRLALIYVGEFGLEGVRWGRLESFRDWEFLGIYPLPGSPSNYHLLDKKDFPYEDLVASADAMVSKVGYGVFAECQINGIPLLYLPRRDFAEFPVLERALLAWGHAYRLSREEYCSLEWGSGLERAARRKRPDPAASEGARICAREIESFIRRFPRGRAR